MAVTTTMGTNYLTGISAYKVFPFIRNLSHTTFHFIMIEQR